MRIYLDHNATTPIAPEVLEILIAAQREQFGNASSVHAFGQMAKSLVDDARASVADLIGGRSQEIIFTSGGTESDNLAIRGVAEAAASSKRRRLVVSSIEHEAVLNTVKALGKIGWSTSFLPVDNRGIVLPEVLSKAITDDTALVSVMHANNEIGAVQPIRELAGIAHRHGALFHTDAVQSTGKISVTVNELDVDLLSLSAHKFNGPKGVGALWLKRGSRLAATMTGGRQERNRRAGTENVPGISGLGAAARLAAENLAELSKKDTAELRNRLETGILASVPDTFVNGNMVIRVPNTTNISFDRVEAESLLIALDLEGVAVSTGSACSSGTLEPSHVLRAMGLSTHRTQNSIRFSLGLGNTSAQIDHVIKIMPRIVEKLRNLSRSGSQVRS